MNAIQIIKNGIVKENPTFVLMLGMCPTFSHNHIRYEWYVDGTCHNGGTYLHQFRYQLLEVGNSR